MNARFVPALALSVVALAGCGSAAVTAGSTPPSTTEPVTTPASPTHTPAPATSTTTAAPPPSAAYVPCTPSMLRLSIAYGGGAAGTVYHFLVAANVGPKRCELVGAPMLWLRTARGTLVGGPSRNGPFPSNAHVVLAPGERAAAQFGVANAQNYSAQTCHPVRVPTLNVQLATASSAVVMPFSSIACTNPRIALITVDAFTTDFHPVGATP